MSAGETLRRLLVLLPLASREEGVDVAEAARVLGVDVDRVVRDIDVLTSRSWYLPAGSADDLQIQFDGGHLRVSGPGMFARPLRLTKGELLALSVALRVTGMASDEAKRVCDEIERELAGGAGPDALPHRLEEPALSYEASRVVDFMSEAPEPMPEAPFPADADGVRDTFSRGVLERRVVAFAYLKPNADEREVRTLEPYRLLHAEGEWYVVGRDRDRDGLRLFRLDRVLTAGLRDASFEPDPEFDIREIVRDGQVALVTEDAEPTEVEVRYSERVARWVAERWDGRADGDGAYVVRHPIYEKRWLMRTVMRYGGEAEVG